jgi:Tfp pilus assembly protein PilN
VIIIGVTEVRITIAKKYLQNQTISLLTSHQQLADAPKQAAAALEKQSPMYNQMQQATEALKFPAQKMKEAMDAITKEAAAFH